MVEAIKIISFYLYTYQLSWVVKNNFRNYLGVIMINKKLFTGLLVLGLGLLVGCANNKTAEKTSTNKNYEVVQLVNYDPVIIKVSGYGTYGKTNTSVNASQQKLLAMRASKMDAYRNLAERIYGTRIQGNTSVHNLAAQDDNIRGYVDNLVRGAKVISTKEVTKGSYETQMEVVLEPRFQQCLVRDNSIYARQQCTQFTVHGEHPSQRMPVSQQQQEATSVYMKRGTKAPLQPRDTQLVEVSSQPSARYFLD